MSIRDRDGRNRHEAGAPAAQGGRFAAASTPGEAVRLTPAAEGRSVLEQVYDEEYRMAGHAPTPGDVIFGIESVAAGHTPDAEVAAYFDFAKRQGKYDQLVAAAGDLDEPYSNESWTARLAAVEAACIDVDPVPDVVGGLTASEGYLGATKVTGSMHDGARSLSDAEVNKLIRTDIKHAQECGYLPAALKARVRKARGYSAVYVTVSGIPRELVWHPGDPYDADDPRPSGRVGYGEALVDRLTVVAGAYGRDNSNSMVDYFDSYRMPSITFDYDEPDPIVRRGR